MPPVLTTSDKVTAAIADCDLWYLSRRRDIRTLTERTEALWFEVEDEVAWMRQAEHARDADAVARHLARILRCLTRIYAEAEQSRGK